MRKLIEISSVTTSQQIARASLILMMTSCVGYLLTLAKEILVAANFGISKEMDAYYAAMTWPLVITGSLLSAFEAVFIPLFIKYRTKSRQEVEEVINIIGTNLVIFLSILLIIVFIFAPFLVSIFFPGFSPLTVFLAASFLRTSCLLIFFSTLVAIISALLNAEKHFTSPAFSSLIISISVILFLICLKNKIGIYALLWGLVSGTFIQLLILLMVIKRRGYFSKLNFSLKHPMVTEMSKLFYIYLLVIILSNLNIAVDRFMASWLGIGSLAALGYAGKFITVPLQLFAGPIITASFPYFASQYAENRLEDLKQSLASSIRMAGFIFIPLTVVLLIFSRPFIQILFQRGEFTLEATYLTSMTFSCYSFQLLFYIIGLLLVRIFLVLGDMKTLLILTILGVIYNVCFNLLFIQLIKPAIAGIALSTSVVYFINCCSLFILLKRRFKYLSGRYIMEGMVKIGIATLIMSMVIIIMMFIINRTIVHYSLIGQIIRVGIPILVGGVIFILMALLLRIDELKKWLSTLNRNKNV